MVGSVEVVGAEVLAARLAKVDWAAMVETEGRAVMAEMVAVVARALMALSLSIPMVVEVAKEEMLVSQG